MCAFCCLIDFFCSKLTGSDRHIDGPWQRGVEQVPSPLPLTPYHPPLHPHSLPLKHLLQTQKPRAPREGQAPAADPSSPGWNSAKPQGTARSQPAPLPSFPETFFEGKRGDRLAPQAAAGAAGVPQPAKGDSKVKNAPLSRCHFARVAQPPAVLIQPFRRSPYGFPQGRRRRVRRRMQLRHRSFRSLLPCYSHANLLSKDERTTPKAWCDRV